MKKIITTLVLALALFTTAFAANSLDSIDITVALQDDGSALISQVWTGDFREGTENYIVQNNMNDMELLNFTVSDNTYGLYEALDDWNIDASRKDKAGKSGVVDTENGYELCWGIGDEYGEKTYTVTYKMTNMVRRYTDSDGFLVRFINDELSAPPARGSVRIFKESVAITDDNADIWAFGYDGTILFQDDMIYATTQESMSTRNHMTLMVRLDSGIVNPTSTVNAPWQTVADKAVEDSDYDSPQTMEKENRRETTIFFMFLSFFALIIGSIIFISIWVQIKRKKAYNAAPIFRDIPQGGNLPASHWLAVNSGHCKDKNDIIGATLLRFIYRGNLEVLTDEQSTFFGLSSRETTSLRLISPPTSGDQLEDDLYDCLQKAAREDGILQEKELASWCGKHYTQFMGLADLSLVTGEGWLSQRDCFTKGKNWYYVGRNLTEKGHSQLDQIYGFKKYLLDFTLIGERDASQVGVWQEIMVYASLLGLADVVEKQFAKLYPEFYEMPEMHNTTRAIYVASAMNRVAYRSAHNAYQSAQAARSSGSGGGASFGGGGGFSGGGSGGGSR